jgi:hypothetical protein
VARNSLVLDNNIPAIMIIKLKKEKIMNIELSSQDLNLLKIMLDKELGDTRVEIRHAENNDYKQWLKDREKEVRIILELISPANALASEG